MNVVMQKREYLKWCEFEVGDCFIFNGKLYMKIKEIDEFNSVCLNDGSLKGFFSEDYVEFADASVDVI